MPDFCSRFGALELDVESPNDGDPTAGSSNGSDTATNSNTFSITISPKLAGGATVAAARKGTINPNKVYDCANGREIKSFFTHETPNATMTSVPDRPRDRASRWRARLATPERKIRYLLCLDVEATCDEAFGFGEFPNEIIELPCVIYDLDACVEVDSFRTYVRPSMNPNLSEFCTLLTGITQDQVSDAPSFRQALNLLAEFLESHRGIVYPPPHLMRHLGQPRRRSSTAQHPLPPTKMTSSKRKFFSARSSSKPGQQPREPERNWAFCCDGKWDIEDFIVKRQLPVTGPSQLPPWLCGTYVDIRMLFAEYFEQDGQKNIEAMLAQFRLAFQGRQHSGLFDSRNIAIIARELQEHDCLIKVNRWVSADGRSGLVKERKTKVKMDKA